MKELAERYFPFLTRNIVLLSVISLFTDVASEMIYPVLPLYITAAGMGFVELGLIMGVADGAASLSKGLFGYLADRYQNRVVFIRLGYAFSAASKVLFAIAPQFLVIMGARLIDRLGKAMRTAPRDALLAYDATSENRGRVFSFHRSMDTLGATIGPVIALVVLILFPGQFSLLFVIALIPGLFAIFCTWLVRDRMSTVSTIGVESVTTARVKPRVSFTQIWTSTPREFKLLVLGLTLLSLLNSADVFLILRAKQILTIELPGAPIDAYVIFLYILFNVAFTLLAYPIGYVSDKLGFKPVMICGLLVFGVVHTLLGNVLPIALLIICFLLWAVFVAINEAITKAWVSSYLPAEVQSTGIGFVLSLEAVAILVSNVLTGLGWQILGVGATYSIIALLSLVLVTYFLVMRLPSVEAKAKSELGCNPGH